MVIIQAIPLIVLVTCYIFSFSPVPTPFQPFLPAKALKPSNRPGFPNFILNSSNNWILLTLIISLLIPLTYQANQLGIHFQSSNLFSLLFYLFALSIHICHLPLTTPIYPVTISLFVNFVASFYFLLEDTSLVNLCLLFCSIIALSVHGSLPLQPYKLDPQLKLSGNWVREDYTTLWSWCTVSWFGPLIKHAGKKKILELDDANPLPSWMGEEEILARWDEVAVYDKLWKNLLRVNAADILIVIAASTTQVVLMYSGPFFTNLILVELSKDIPSPRTTIKYGFYMFFFAIVNIELYMNVLWFSRRAMMRWRSVIMGKVFRKTLKKKDLSGYTEKDKDQIEKKGDKKKPDEKKEKQADQGKILNLMSSDANTIGSLVFFISPIVQAPFEFGIGVFFLYRLLGWSGFVGTIVLPMAVLASKIVSTYYHKLVKETNTVKDKRMTSVNEMLQSIRQIKWFGWENQFAKKILGIRDDELSLVWKMAMLSCVMTLIWGTILPGITYLSFFSFVKFAKQELTIPIAFTTLQIFSMLAQPIGFMSSGILQLIRLYASVKRVENFLNEDEVPNWVSSFENDEETNGGRPTEQRRVGFETATFAYEEEESEEKDKVKQSTTTEVEEEAPLENKGFRLIDIDVTFPEAKISLITGASGSGKTSLLLALLGEMNLKSGKLFLPKQRTVVDEVTGLYNGVAYAAQAPWLQHASVRDNILFGTPFDQERYDAVIEACALKTDLQLLDEGDMTEIGEKGVSLSGGQKARVALARALYSYAKILLLDDTLSAVDTHVGAHIVNSFTSKLFAGRTVLLVTHAVDLCLPIASFMVTMSEGRIILAENVASLSSVDEASTELTKVLKKEEKIQENIEQQVEEEESQTDAEIPQKKVSKLVEEEKKAQGSVSFEVYKSYIKSCGYWMWLLVIAAYVISTSSDMLSQIFFKIWGEAYGPIDENDPPTAFVLMSNFRHTVSYGLNSIVRTNNRPWGLPDPRENVNPYLLIFLAIDVWIVIVHFLSSLVMALLNWRASKSMFEGMVLSVVGGTFRYFDKTPTGRILNRFSQDFATVDQELPRWLEDFIWSVFEYLRAIIVVVVIIPWYLVATAIMLVIYFHISQMYLGCSRELRRLESISKSPIFSHFGETLSGLITIRAFGAEKRFDEESRKRVDGFMRLHNSLWMSNRWLMARFDCVGATSILISILLVVFGKLSAGLAALVITSASSLTRSTYWMLRSYGDLELNFNAVERIEELKTIPHEPPAILESRRPPAWWPSDKGSIVIEDFKMSYAPDLPLVLKGISAMIGSKEKVGIVGRTGSGKSSLTFGLLRCVEPMGGRILVDGIDITTIGTEDLRKKITLIPQDPAIFSGTIRSNLDPFDEHSDDECWDVLRRVQLVSSSHQQSGLNSPSSGTSTPVESEDTTLIGSEILKSRRIDIKSLKDPVSAGGGNLSSGQRQLLSLARAMLRSSRIVILDEATASVDFDTDLKVQEAIRTDFADSIVLTIAHRLQTVIDYDKIMVLDKGTIVEYDSPDALLKKEGGIFKEMWDKRK